jgi:hypothetical protein
VGRELPLALRTNPEQQKHHFVALAGPYMGLGKRQGETYTWVPNHLADAAQKVSPRSFLAAVRRAAEQPELPGQQCALHWKGIQEGVRSASQYRVKEVGEDLPWAHAAMTMLGDLTVPCPAAKLRAAWRAGELLPPLAQEEGRPATDSDYDDTLKQLATVGILEQLPERRINIPDVYRVGFGLRRRGGFAPD